MKTVATRADAPSISTLRFRLTARAALALVALLIIVASCGGNSDGGAVNLDTLRPLATDVDLKPGTSLELTFEPSRDDLAITVDEAPPGITASVKPGPTDATMILAIDVASDIAARGEIEIVLAVDEQGQTTLVPWPFMVIDN